jgi:hypothetical protein
VQRWAFRRLRWYLALPAISTADELASAAEEVGEKYNASRANTYETGLRKAFSSRRSTAGPSTSLRFGRDDNSVGHG